MTGYLVVLGIDPGSIVTGYGAVALTQGRTRPLGWGSVRTSSDLPLAERLKVIHDEIARQIELFKPDQVAVENVFLSKNAKSALKLGHARGVALLAAAEAGLPVFEYAPREVKCSVVGIGSASKDQVASMVVRLLGIEEQQPREDESDALAVAVCHVHKISGASVR